MLTVGRPGTEIVSDVPGGHGIGWLRGGGDPSLGKSGAFADGKNPGTNGISGLLIKAQRSRWGNAYDVRNGDYSCHLYSYSPRVAMSRAQRSGGSSVSD